MGSHQRNLDPFHDWRTLCCGHDLGCQCLCRTYKEDHSNCSIPYWLWVRKYHFATAFSTALEGKFLIKANSLYCVLTTDKPRYRPTWIILLVVSFGRSYRRPNLKNISLISPQVAAILPSIVIIILRVYLSRENKRRDKLEATNQVNGNGIIETTDSDGGLVTRVVDNSQMDLTDRENLTL